MKVLNHFFVCVFLTLLIIIKRNLFAKGFFVHWIDSIINKYNSMSFRGYIPRISKTFHFHRHSIYSLFGPLRLLFKKRNFSPSFWLFSGFVEINVTNGLLLFVSITILDFQSWIFFHAKVIAILNSFVVDGVSLRAGWRWHRGSSVLF